MEPIPPVTGDAFGAALRDYVERGIGRVHVIERDAPGIAEWLRVNSVNNFPKAALSRGRSGVRNRTLIVNLPGSPGGVKDSLAALDPIVDHAVAVLRGEVADHGKK